MEVLCQLLTAEVGQLARQQLTLHVLGDVLHINKLTTNVINNTHSKDKSTNLDMQNVSILDTGTKIH